MKWLFFLIILMTNDNIFTSDNIFIKLSEDPWPPFTYGDVYATHGYAVEFTEQIFLRLDLDYEIRLYPWQRCLNQMKSGIRDGVILSGINDDRKEYMEFTIPIMYDRDLIWYKLDKDEIKWSNFEDLKDFTFAATRGFSYGSTFTDSVEFYDINIIETNSDLQNFKLLKENRVDLFICNETVALSLFKDNPELQGIFTYTKKPLKEVSLHMAFSKKSKYVYLVSDINKIIVELQNEGIINRILGR